MTLPQKYTMQNKQNTRKKWINPQSQKEILIHLSQKFIEQADQKIGEEIEDVNNKINKLIQ